MSRYNDSYSRGRSRNDRDRSPDYQYAGGTAPPQVPYPPPDAFYSSSSNVRIPSPGHRQYYPPSTSHSQARLTYEPQSPLYTTSQSNLHVHSDSHSRPRSLGPPVEYRGRGSRSHNGRGKRDDSEERDHSPISRARHAVKDTFTDSTTGLGVGVLGALVGGLAAHEASEATSRHGGNGHQTEAQKRTQLISTVVGAAVGALGANAVEKRLELNREKDRVKQEKWEREFRPQSRESLGYISGGSGGKAEIIEKREVITRPRSASGRKKGWDWDLPEGGRKREVDPDARSWRDVEDWVYDEEGSRDRGSRRSGDRHRY